jgi:hypothetical protein
MTKRPGSLLGLESFERRHPPFINLRCPVLTGGTPASPSLRAGGQTQKEHLHVGTGPFPTFCVTLQTRSKKLTEVVKTFRQRHLH